MSTAVEVEGSVALLAPETAERLQSIVMTTRDLPAMPQVAAKVLELASDPALPRPSSSRSSRTTRP